MDDLTSKLDNSSQGVGASATPSEPNDMTLSSQGIETSPAPFPTAPVSTVPSASVFLPSSEVPVAAAEKPVSFDVSPATSDPLSDLPEAKPVLNPLPVEQPQIETPGEISWSTPPVSAEEPMASFHPDGVSQPPVQPDPPAISTSQANQPSSSDMNPSQPHSPVIKIFLFVFILAVLGGLGFAFWKFVLPGLSFGTKPATTLTYWGLWEDESVLKPFIAEYEKIHKEIKIDYKKQSPTEYRERLQAAISQGKGPDIFRFHNTWVPMLKNELSPVPATVFSQGDFQKTFYPVALKDLKREGELYGIPLEIDGLALLYNVDIFKAAGVSPPTTWNELRRDASILTVKDSQKRIQTAGIALGTTNNVDSWSDILGLMFLENGADLKSPQGKAAEEVLLYYTSYSQGDNKTWDETLPPSSLAFAQNKVAMIFAPSWQILNIKTKNPQLDFNVLPVPQLSGVNTTWASYWVEGVSVKSTHQAEAWEFLKYLSQKETLTKLYTETSKARFFGEPYSRQDLGVSLKDDPYLGPYIQQAATAQSFYLASNTFDNGINDKMIKYLENAVNSVNQGVSPRSALEPVNKGFKQVLSTYP